MEYQDFKPVIFRKVYKILVIQILVIIVQHRERTTLSFIQPIINNKNTKLK